MVEKESGEKEPGWKESEAETVSALNSWLLTPGS